MARLTSVVKRENRRMRRKAGIMKLEVWARLLQAKGSWGGAHQIFRIFPLAACTTTTGAEACRQLHLIMQCTHKESKRGTQKHRRHHSWARKRRENSSSMASLNRCQESIQKLIRVFHKIVHRVWQHWRLQEKPSPSQIPQRGR